MKKLKKKSAEKTVAPSNLSSRSGTANLLTQSLLRQLPVTSTVTTKTTSAASGLREQLSSARQIFVSGQTQLAHRLFAQIEEQGSEDPDLLNDLACARAQLGEVKQGLQLLLQVMQRFPLHLNAYLNRIKLCRQLNQGSSLCTDIRNQVLHVPADVRVWQEIDSLARAHQDQVLIDIALAKLCELDPENPAYWNSLAQSYARQARYPEALAAMKTTCALAPQQAGYWCDQGYISYYLKNYAEAIDCYRKALAINPQLSTAYLNLGVALSENGDVHGAEDVLRQGTQLAPESAALWNNLGIILAIQAKKEEAEEVYLKSLQLDDTNASYWVNYGNLLKDHERPYEAEDAFRRGLALQPHYPAAWNNLGSALGMQGRQEEGLDAFRLSFEQDKHYDTAINNILFTATHIDSLTPDAVFAEHLRLGEHLTQLVGGVRFQHTQHRQSNKRLRIGIVSGDFRNHVVSLLFEPVWENLQRQEFDWYLYSNTALEDQATERIRQGAKVFRKIVGLTDHALANLIYEDQIDILIDLAGHTSSNRLKTFIQKPAPIQASWLGHPHSTGLSCMDYYLADHRLVPAKLNAHLFSEQLVRLPGGYGFSPYAEAEDVAPLPALKNGYITFGSFNRANKLGPKTLALWSRVLHAVPNSKMMLGPLKDEKLRESIWQSFESHQIDRERISFFSRQKVHAYLKKHDEMDLLLDTLPFTGCGTTVNALWQGLPILTLAGVAPQQRQGAMFMQALDLPEWAPEDEDAFVRQAQRICADIPALAELRMRMRERFKRSSFFQPELIAQSMAQAFRQMWTSWCQQLPPVPIDVTDVKLVDKSLARELNRLGADQNYAEMLRLCEPNALTDTQRDPEVLAWHGIAAFHLRQLPEAAARLQQALLSLDTNAYLWNMYGVVLSQQQLQAQAVQAYETSWRLDTSNSDAIHNLANALFESGNVTQAYAAFQTAFKHFPRDLKIWQSLAQCAERDMNWPYAVQAREAIRQLVGTDQVMQADCQLARILGLAKQFDKALQVLQQYAHLLNEDAELSFVMGVSLQGVHQLDNALLAYQTAVRLAPDAPKYLVGLATGYSAQRKFDLAAQTYQAALKLNPQDTKAWNNLGYVLETMAQQEQALQCYENVLRISPRDESALNNYLFGLTKSDMHTPEKVFDEHRKWGGAPIYNPPHVVQSYQNIPDPTRKLRIGFVSGDFRTHVVSSLFEQVWQSLNRDQFVWFLYSNSNIEDKVTANIRAQEHQWRNIFALSDFDAAQLILSDGIDILIDLGGRTAGNRLSLFALKPAPIQMSWLGHPYTTGSPAIDYFLIDKHLAPISLNGKFFVEKLIRLEAAYAFRPLYDACSVNALPALKNGYVTFASFNRPNKLGAKTIALWAHVLNAVPDSKLLIGPIEEPVVCEHLLHGLMAYGIDAQRIQFMPWMSMPDYMHKHHEVDILLDAFPFSGGGTSLNGLWQGVPIVSLTGESPQQRQGDMYLHHVGLSDWIASTEQEFVSIAVQKAQDLSSLSELRAQLRERLIASPLGSGGLSAQAICLGLRAAWQLWCANRPAQDINVMKK